MPAFYAGSNNGGAIQMFTSYTGVAGSSAELGQTISGGHGIAGAGGILYATSSVTMTGITDGTSNTIMVGEQSDHLRDVNNQPIPGGFGAITSQGPHGWTMGAGGNQIGIAYGDRTFNCSTTRWMINQRGLGNNSGNGTHDNTGNNIPFSSGHSGGAMMGMGDGSVRFMRATTTLQMLQWFSTRAGGEVIIDN